MMPVDNEEPMLMIKDDPKHSIEIKGWKWWFFVALNISFLIIGQSAAIILGRFYYDNGGKNKWMVTLIQSAASPILLVPYLFINRNQTCSNDSNPSSIIVISFVYLLLGVLLVVDNMLYSIGLFNLSASTYSLICATQLAFNAVFSFFINRQRFTVLILNSVMILTLSASLLAFNDDDGVDNDHHSRLDSKGKSYIIGFVITLLASALYSLFLSLMQLSFEKVIKKETFSVVMEMQICTSITATIVSMICLFSSGEWKTLGSEMDAFVTGRFSYVLTLVGNAVASQICSLGVIGLVFLVSSLYSNVISTLSLAVTPIASVIVFNDKMNGIKIIAMAMAIWGFCSYVYQNYLDEIEARKIRTNVNDNTSIGSSC